MPTQSPSLLIFLLAIPVFILTIAIEWWFTRRYREEKLYSITDTMTNLHLGQGQLLIGAVTKGPLLALYHVVYLWSTSWGLPAWDLSLWWVWPLGFIIMDFAYYWFHRFSHEVNFLWAAHAVHHQSEYYNLSVALRQSWIQQLYSGIFYIPLALLGIPTSMFFLLNSLNTLSQYWIHTQMVYKLGFLESFLNTPSHHRVHHGTDDIYVDKNYAGAFIVWDRMFGTFTEEEVTPKFGVIKPLRSWNPTWANLDVWSLMWQRLRKKELSFWQSLSLPFREPAWQGPQESSLGIKLRTEVDYQLYDESSSFLNYAVLMGVLDINLGALLLILAPQLTSFTMWSIVIYLLISASIHNGLFTKKVWPIYLEAVRYILVFSTLFWSDLWQYFHLFEVKVNLQLPLFILHLSCLLFFILMGVKQRVTIPSDEQIS